MSNMLRIVPLFFLLLYSNFTWSEVDRVFSTSTAERTHEFVLGNGLKLIVREDHRAPVVVTQVWYKVGSSYEPPGITGVSHVLEHMMFKGTRKIPPGEFSKIIAKVGGEENAFTSRDYTAYFQRLSADKLPLCFELEADRMVNLTLPEDEFEKELKVVMEERRLRTEDNPQAKAYERFNKAAYTSSPYGQPVIGWMHDLERLTIDDLRYWYEKWYAPNNATVVVVGDVEPQEVHRLARKYFGAIPARKITGDRLPREIGGLGIREVKVKIPAQLPTLFMGFNTPGINTAAEDWEVYALYMLANVLDGGYSARIESNIVRGNKVASSAGSSYSPLTRGDSLLVFSAVPNDGYSLDDVKNALLQEIELLKSSLARPEELERAQAQVIAGRVYQQDSISQQANQIGRLETSGVSWQIGDLFSEKIKAVTAEQIQAVAKKYLVEDNLTVTKLFPEQQ